jgi:hypothetical protein
MLFYNYRSESGVLHQENMNVCLYNNSHSNVNSGDRSSDGNVRNNPHSSYSGIRSNNSRRKDAMGASNLDNIPSTMMSAKRYKKA